MKKLLIAIAIATNLAHAGEMKTTVDNFTNESTTFFVSHISATSVAVFRRANGEASLTVTARDGLPNCRRLPLMLKTADGKVHQLLNTFQVQGRACNATVDPAWLKDEFQVRMPMFNRASVDIQVNSKGMDWDAMGTKSTAE